MASDSGLNRKMEKLKETGKEIGNQNIRSNTKKVAAIFIVGVIAIGLIMAGFFFVASSSKGDYIYVNGSLSNSQIFPFEKTNLTISVSTLHPKNDVVVSILVGNKSYVVLFPKLIKNSSVSFPITLNSSATIRLIPDSLYLYPNIKKNVYYLDITVKKPNMSFYEVPEYKKITVTEVNSLGLQALGYLTSQPLSILKPYIFFYHTEEVLLPNNKTIRIGYIQTTLSPAEIANFYGYITKTQPIRIGQAFHIQLNSTELCVTYKNGFVKMIEGENCISYLNETQKRVNVTKENFALNITSPAIGEIFDTDGAYAKGFSYKYGYYFIWRYPKEILCNNSININGLELCAKSELRNVNNYQYKFINISSRNYGVTFFNFNASAESDIQQTAVSILGALNKNYSR